MYAMTYIRRVVESRVLHLRGEVATDLQSRIICSLRVTDSLFTKPKWKERNTCPHLRLQMLV